MRLRRGPLFWGLLLVPLGGIPLLVRAGLVDADSLSQVWRLWPLALVGIGLALVLGRMHAGALGTAVAAIAIGVVGGSALASGNVWIGAMSDCGDFRAPTQSTQGDGTFTGTATVTIDVRCGSVDLDTAARDDWQVDAKYGEVPPGIDATDDRLAVRVPSQGSIGRQEWSIVVPDGSIAAVDLEANAASANLRLPGASLSSLAATVNAADLLIDVGDGEIDRLDVAMNAGRVRISLGDGRSGGTISVNAGSVDLCVPPAASLRLTVNDQLTFGHNLRSRGLTQSGTTWTRVGTGAGTIDLRIEGNAASLTLDPDGGCR